MKERYLSRGLEHPRQVLCREIDPSEQSVGGSRRRNQTFFPKLLLPLRTGKHDSLPPATLVSKYEPALRPPTSESKKK